MHRTIPLAAAVAFAPAALAQNLAVNGGFEDPPIGAPWVQRLPGEVFGGWTVDPGPDTQGIVQVGSFGNPLAAEGRQCLELNFYVQGGVSQAIPTAPGQVYEVSVLLAGQTNAGPDTKHMRIDWEGSEAATLTWSRSQSGGAWQAHTLRVTATTSPSVLHFRGLEGVDGGPYLDAVVVTAVGCPADFNGDGFLDFFDYDDYVNCFETGSCPPGKTADFNGDNFADFFDYLDFVSGFEAGC